MRIFPICFLSLEWSACWRITVTDPAFKSFSSPFVNPKKYLHCYELNFHAHVKWISLHRMSNFESYVEQYDSYCPCFTYAFFRLPNRSAMVISDSLIDSWRFRLDDSPVTLFAIRSLLPVTSPFCVTFVTFPFTVTAFVTTFRSRFIGPEISISSHLSAPSTPNMTSHFVFFSSSDWSTNWAANISTWSPCSSCIFRYRRDFIGFVFLEILNSSTWLPEPLPQLTVRTFRPFIEPNFELNKYINRFCISRIERVLRGYYRTNTLTFLLIVIDILCLHFHFLDQHARRWRSFRLDQQIKWILSWQIELMSDLYVRNMSDIRPQSSMKSFLFFVHQLSNCSNSVFWKFLENPIFSPLKLDG